MTPVKNDTELVIQALKKVPEKRLLISELVNMVSLKGGDLDHEELLELQPEVNLAVAEAKAYGGHTIKAVEALLRVPAVMEEGGIIRGT